MTPRTRVLIVDASPTGRLRLTRGLAADGRFQVVGAVAGGEDLFERLDELVPDVVVLELGCEAGIDVVRTLETKRPTPTVVLCAPSPRGARLALEALAAGAVDVVQKPAQGAEPDVIFEELRAKLAIAAQAHVTTPGSDEDELPPSRVAPTGMEVIALGGSTGGPAAVERIVTHLPRNAPPVLVVLHMPSGFTRTFAQRLNKLSRLQFVEAEDGAVLREGWGYLAPGGRQLRVRRRGLDLAIALGEATRVSDHAPSVDVTFHSIAEAAGPRCVAALLTGMGSDGAEGLLAIRRAGGRTLAQDEASCVVYGMPRAAQLLGAVERTVPLDELAVRLVARPASQKPPQSVSANKG